MRVIYRSFLWILAFTLLSSAGPREVSASLIRQMTFEEVTTQAAVIVLGRVTAVPDMAIYDRASHHVYRHNRVHVDQYLKGTGSTPEIEVLTLGGEFDTDGLGLEGPRIQFVNYGGDPQLPPVGSEVLLFLSPVARGEAFIIYSASHGVVRVQEGEKGQERFVSLLIRNPDLLSPASAARLREMHPGASESAGPIVTEQVGVSALKAVVDKVLNLKRKAPAVGGEPNVP
jgi:hypothetical protein